MLHNNRGHLKFKKFFSCELNTSRAFKNFYYAHGKYRPLHTELTSFCDEEPTISLNLTSKMKMLKFHAYESTSHRKYHNGLLKKDFEWAVELNRYCLESLGLWPKSEQTICKKRMCNLRALLVFSMILFVLMIPGIHSAIRTHFDIILLTDNLQCSLPILTIILRFVIFWWKKKAITPLIDMIANDWLKMKTSQEEATMIEKAQIARMIITIGYALMGSGWVVVVILPMFGYSVRSLSNITDAERLLPIPTYYIYYDTTKSPQYEIMYTVQSVTLFFCIMAYTGIDNFLSLSVFHISGQLNILRNRLMHLDKVVNYNDVLKTCVIEHNRLFRAIDHIKDIFNIILLILFLYFGILFAFYGLWIINILESEERLTMTHLVYILSLFTNTFGHMCLYCAVGEMLTSECDSIQYAVYFNEWYIMDPRNARDLILLLIRTHKPLYLNIGELFPLTMATFCKLLKTSAGFISVLLTTRSQPKI